MNITKSLYVMYFNVPRATNYHTQRSISAISSSLELVHFDVWGHAPNSIGRYKYHVSIIDDYSKNTWLY